MKDFRSPCLTCLKGCEDKIESRCIETCEDILLYQQTVARWGINAVFKDGVCAICRLPATGQYCDCCRGKVMETSPYKLKYPNRKSSSTVSKKPKGHTTRTYTVRVLKIPRECEYCGKAFTIGDEALTRNKNHGVGFACFNCASEDSTKIIRIFQQKQLIYGHSRKQA